MKMNKDQLNGLLCITRVVLFIFAVFGSEVRASAVDMTQAEQLVASKRYGEALQLLRASSKNDDIYSCECSDAPHQHRSAARRLLIVECLLALNRKDEAREELRSLYEDRIEPAYLIPDKSNILLIELETEHGYEAFELWLTKRNPVATAQYEGSIQHVASLKKAIEAGRFDESMRMLDGLEAYHLFLVPPRRFTWQREAVIAYLVRNPKSLPFLIRHLSRYRDNRIYDLNLGVIFCLGEIGKPEAVPALREAMETENNSSTRLELVFALAKCGDAGAVPEVYEHRAGSLQHQQLVDRLLRRLTGKEFGTIDTQEAAKAVFEKWGAYIQKKGDVHPIPGKR